MDLLNTIQLGRCEDFYPKVEDESIDLIVTDPPYGVTACAWDKRPDLSLMWEQFNRIIKPNGAVVLTATQPFATDVINANRKYFRYDLVCIKNTAVGFLNANTKAMFEWIIKSYSEKDSVVFDPYMGSGTTAVSAVSTGRRFIGFEQDPGFYAMTMARIQAEIESQKVMFAA